MLVAVRLSDAADVAQVRWCPAFGGAQQLGEGSDRRAERGHYAVSVAVAETALLPAVRAADPDAVVLADGFSCRTQLGQLSDRSGEHLAQLLDRE